MRSVTLVVAFCILAFPLLVGCSSSKTAGVAVDHFRKAVVGKSFSPRKTFYDEYGEPSRISDVGDDTYLYYKCKDGEVIVKTPKGPFQHQDMIAPFGVDRP